MYKPFKTTADTLSKKSSSVLDAFNKTLESLNTLQNKISDRDAVLEKEITERKTEKESLAALSERNSKIIANFKTLIES